MHTHHSSPRSGASVPSPGAECGRRAKPSAGAAEEEALRAQSRSLHEQVLSLRKQVHARTRIAVAQGLLMGRYQLADPEVAFDVLRQVSQRCNVKLHQIAVALTSAPAPAFAPAAQPGPRPLSTARTRVPAPRLDALHAGRLNPKHQGQVLSAALERVMDLTGADFGNVQLAEAGVLRLEQYVGHPQLFTDHFAFVQEGTASWRAAEAGRQVTVRDVESATLFDDETRQVLLDSGSRAVHCIPCTAGDGIVRGVISAHHNRPQPNPLDQEQLAELARLQRVVGTWLHWHTDTVLSDALDHLHHTAAAARMPSAVAAER